MAKGNSLESYAYVMRRSRLFEFLRYLLGIILPLLTIPLNPRRFNCNKCRLKHFPSRNMANSSSLGNFLLPLLLSLFIQFSITSSRILSFVFLISPNYYTYNFAVPLHFRLIFSCQRTPTKTFRITSN